MSQKKKNKIFWPWYFGGGLLLCLILVTYTFRYLWWPESKPLVATPAVINETLPFRHPLTGELSVTEITKPQVFAVMIENSAEAWPLAGLEDAFLVIEAPVEASIPRFVAFYDSNQTVEKIGSVRSARSYYLDWVAEFSALYAHVGGSPEALSLIRNSDLFDLNQFWHDQYFWRSADRFAPHNVYTSSGLLNQVLTNQKEPQEIDYGLWSFKNAEPTENPIDPNLFLNHDSSLYRIEWKYQPETNDYLRRQNDREMTSADGDSIKANNVAVVYTEILAIDALDRKEIQTIGQGEALVLQDGKKIPAVWQKESATDRLRFYSEDGKEIKWNAGKIWIEIVSTLDK
ncbi:MAG: DUF3048 domain-containing protein [Candidatus Uhrbacteria bacterium]